MSSMVSMLNGSQRHKQRYISRNACHWEMWHVKLHCYWNKRAVLYCGHLKIACQFSTTVVVCLSQPVAGFSLLCNYCRSNKKRTIDPASWLSATAFGCSFQLATKLSLLYGRLAKRRVSWRAIVKHAGMVNTPLSFHQFVSMWHAWRRVYRQHSYGGQTHQQLT